MGFSPVDCILTDTTVVEPDLVYVESARSSSYALTEGAFRAVAQLSGADRGSLPPFSELIIAADTLWP